MHHEREDGSGYPNGLKSEEIDLTAKIIAVADMFDTLTSVRVDHKAVSPFEAFEIIEAEGYKGHNMAVIMKFLENAPNYYVGERFFLNTGETGEIVFINPSKVYRPLIKVGDRYIDLSYDRSIKIESMI
ncbi:hypothetical protein SDC9_202432 [bioreactor metagenome]|uniref:HD-GYP domain-containing protein n=1 Tax=bioreactor metagenome TaxID=1076179 RepID=A0A645ITK6_9ZZZZ